MHTLFCTILMQSGGRTARKKCDGKRRCSVLWQSKWLIQSVLQKIDRPALKPLPDCTNAMAIGNDKQIVVYIDKGEIAFIRMPAEKRVASASWFDPVTGLFSEATVGKQCKAALTSPFEDSALLILNL